MEYVTTIKIGENFEEIIESFNDISLWNVSETFVDFRVEEEETERIQLNSLGPLESLYLYLFWNISKNLCHLQNVNSFSLSS